MLLDDPRHQRLLEWELTPPAHRDPKTQEALASELAVSARTLRGWREGAEFQAAWRQAFQAMAGSLEKTKVLLDQLMSDATDPDNPPSARTQAAKLHFDISKAIAPPEPDSGPSKRAAELSDDELRAMLSKAALAELEARQEAAGRV